MEKLSLAGMFAGLMISSLSLMFTGLALLQSPIARWALWRLVFAGATSALVYFVLFVLSLLKYKKS